MRVAHQLALWSGVSALLGNLVGLKVLDLVSDEDWVNLLAGLIFSLVVGLLAYARERVKEAQHEEQRHDLGPGPTTYAEDFEQYAPRVPGRGTPPRY